jgi:hypothetical protein
MKLSRIFNLLSDRNGWANGNYFAFKYLYLIIDNLVKWLDDIVELRYKKKQYIEMRIIKQKQKEMNYPAASYGVSENKANCFVLCKTVYSFSRP